MSQPSSFLRHAKVVGLLTLASRLLGLVREVVSAHFLGTGLIASAFTVAFTIPNLFRKLFGEGALSAAFIPLYAKAVKDEAGGHTSSATTPHDQASDATVPQSHGAHAAVSQDEGTSTATTIDHSADVAAPPASEFAAAAVNLLVAILLGIVIAGEAILIGVLALWHDLRPDHLLTVRLTAIMLPYVLLICGTAFLSGILQVHRRFAAPAAAPILLNLCHIAVLVLGAAVLGLSGRTGQDRADELQTTLVYWLALAVLVAGVLQTVILLPSLRAVGFRFRLVVGLWTPMTRKMLRLTLPVALGAGVVQLSVLLDRGLSTLLMTGVDAAGNAITHFSLFGQTVRYPMEAGAPARLAVAQFMYLFPLGIFATALATAIFPSLSSDALEKDQSQFKASLRQGIEAALWEGIPASVGLILVSEPAIRLLFQHGQITAHDADLIRYSLIFYAAAIWAFSLLQIASRAFYAIHDTVTPLKLAVLNLVINLAVELPMIWLLGEAGMAVGTLVAFSVQAVVMLWLLDRRIGSLGLSAIVRPVLKMIAATALMALVCWGVTRLPVYPSGDRRWIWSAQLAILIGVGAAVYLIACRALGVTAMDQILPRRFRRRPPKSADGPMP